MISSVFANLYVALKAYVADNQKGDSKQEFDKKITSSEDRTGDPAIPVWYSPVRANLTSASWGVFNLTFVGAPYDFLDFDSLIKKKHKMFWVVHSSCFKDMLRFKSFPR